MEKERREEREREVSSTRRISVESREGLELTFDVFERRGKVTTLNLTWVSSSNDDLDVWKSGEGRESASNLRGREERKESERSSTTRSSRFRDHQQLTMDLTAPMTVSKGARVSVKGVTPQ